MDGPPLPDELLALVLEFIPAPQRIAARCVSKRWLGVIDAAPHLWREGLPHGSIIRKLGALCEAGDLEKVQRFIATLGLTAEYGDFALRAACAAGHLHIAVWLASAGYPVSRPVAYPRYSSHAPRAICTWQYGVPTLRAACAAGHTHVAMWLVETFNPTMGDVRGEPDESEDVGDDNGLEGVIGVACKYGHLEIAQWLVGRFNLTAPGEITNCYQAMWDTCHRGHAHIVEWIITTFGCVHNNVVDAWGTACGSGRPAMVRLVAARLGITAERAHAANNAILDPALTCLLYGSNSGDAAAVLQCLVDEFGLVANDIRRVSPRYLSTPVRTWIAERFGPAVFAS
jgi:hypothetical protein